MELFFKPSVDRARRLDQQMRSSLAESVSYLSGELKKHERVDEDKVSAFVAQLEKAPTPPLKFAIYWDLVRAIDADDLEGARTLLDLLVESPQIAPDLQIHDLGDARTDPAAERYSRVIDSDPDLPMNLQTPSAKASQQSRGAIERAFALMEAGDPELFGEIRALLREIVLCSSRPQPGQPTFDGASSAMLWGAIMINADRDSSDLSMVQMLAHESAHNLLFGLCSEERLINNDSKDRYKSPLRIDPRPLEGIYHATFVSARMYRSMVQLAQSGTLSPADRETAETEAQQNKKSFLDGADTLERHGDFTATGRAILESARAGVSEMQAA